jgi:hypothetical protein
MVYVPVSVMQEFGLWARWEDPSEYWCMNVYIPRRFSFPFIKTKSSTFKDVIHKIGIGISPISRCRRVVFVEEGKVGNVATVELHCSSVRKSSHLSKRN